MRSVVRPFVDSRAVFLSSDLDPMPTLYRRPDSPRGDEVQQALIDMVIAHDVTMVRSEADLPDGCSRGDLPILHDDGDLLTDPAALRSRLDTLRSLMAEWDRFGSDACHIEDDGTLCGPHGVPNSKGPGMTSRSLREG